MIYICGVIVGIIIGTIVMEFVYTMGIEPVWKHEPETRPYDWDLDDCDLWQ